MNFFTPDRSFTVYQILMSHQVASTEVLVLIRIAAEGFCQCIGPQWQKIATHLPGRTVHDVRNRWYATLSKREQALIYDTEQILSIRERMRNQEPIPELRGEEWAV
jgi:hypothetical protein